MTSQPVPFFAIAKLVTEQENGSQKCDLSKFQNDHGDFLWCRLSAGLVPHREDDLQLLGRVYLVTISLSPKRDAKSQKKRRVFLSSNLTGALGLGRCNT